MADARYIRKIELIRRVYEDIIQILKLGILQQDSPLYRLANSIDSQHGDKKRL
jgi:hypothetical protein